MRGRGRKEDFEIEANPGYLGNGNRKGNNQKRFEELKMIAGTTPKPGRPKGMLGFLQHGALQGEPKGSTTQRRTQRCLRPALELLMLIRG